MRVQHKNAIPLAIPAVRRLADGVPSTTERNPPMSTATLDDAVYERLLRERIVFLGREVDDVLANQLAAQMLLLAAEDPRRDIHLYVNSPGGGVTAGMAVFDTMRSLQCDVATYAMGMAASMGQFLLTAGTPGKRFALPHARIMMHQPSAGLGGTAADITIQADMLARTKRQLAELQAEHSGQSVEQVERDSDRDRWFTAAEARTYGLIDAVIADAAALPQAGSALGIG
ncbi:ATP-dependent Clp protease proteolytic subunit (Endopeptidase Clp) [Modestobacter italicus]|uniref:ATP-dependent Clp protease proteolytic subunit n=2 Tax=Modestobacter italicus (strain DSM 44449 / CECT 9708 / BC 501) TaxID=2732864 RepID=I4EQA5_MODI5|nr:ATP-dependent Clp protease proteolytic subunit (Endopeptidase Clp) [Modestobacter marinus]